MLTSHLGISTSEAGWRRLPFCPTEGKVREKHLLFSGTAGVSFMAEMQQEGGIQLDDPVPVELSAKDSYPAVYQFIPAEDISSTQLDITVTSESVDVPAYLKVSRDCKDVKENIDVVDYKGESIRLSFAKKGRITLSKFSIPPLTASTSSWFIGIAIKNATGETSPEAAKKVNLTLTRSFDYSYAHPMWMSQLLINVSVGVFFSLLGWFVFRVRNCKKCKIGESDRPPDKSSLSITGGEFFSAMLAVLFIYSFSRGPKTYSYITLIVGSVLMLGSFQFVFADWYLMIQEGDRDHCYYNDFCYRVRYADIPYNLIVSNMVYVLHGLILAITVLCMESEVLARCRKLVKEKRKKLKPKEEEENAKRHFKREKKEMKKKLVEEEKGEQKYKRDTNEIKVQEGRENGDSKSVDQDHSTKKESYEGLPNHVLRCPDISLHLRKMHVPKDDEPSDEMFAAAIKKKYNFSMGYALAWALLFVGVFSALYHLCPSRLTFQFDTAFMFVSAGLSLVWYYNGIEMQECSASVSAKNRVGAANLFLYFVVPILIFNYFGIMYHSEAGLAKVVQIPVFILLGLWSVIIPLWAGYKLFPNTCIVHRNSFVQKCCCSECYVDYKRFSSKEQNEGSKECLTWKNQVFNITGLFLSPILFSILWIANVLELTDALLYLCLCENVVAGLGTYILGSSGGSKSDCCAKWFKISFRLSQIPFLIAAFVIFEIKETTDKSKSPENSRDLNKECNFLEFFDWHDIWHILSSTGLLISALSMIHDSYEPPKEIQEGFSDILSQGDRSNYGSTQTGSGSTGLQTPTGIRLESLVYTSSVEGEP